MKQIIPFKKELLFKTKVSEITSISLEHTLTLKEDDFISGEFHISGDYKMTEGSINRENFQFKLPFEIALDGKYRKDTILIDIDNFYYEVINNEAMQVNIDVYVEGEKVEETIVEPLPPTEVEPVMNQQEEAMPDITFPEITEEDLRTTPPTLKEEETPEVFSTNDEKEPSNLEEKLEPTIERPSIDSIIFEEESEKTESKTAQKEFNIFENIDNSDTYVTYHVYIVKETDTIDSIMKKYEVTKEDMALYNNLEDMKPGMKLIIPN